MERFTEISREKWKFPPTCNRSGKTRGPNDIKEVIRLESDLFAVPTIIMSDLHSHTGAIFERLDREIDLSRYIVLTAGDMAAAEPIFGYDGDPTEFYEFMAQKAGQFYFVQGNHDLPPANPKRLKSMKNSVGKKCYIEDAETVMTEVGMIGGINGTVSDKKHPYKKTHEEFYRQVDHLFKRPVRIFITHETPSYELVMDDGVKRELVGQPLLYEKVVKKRPVVHIYGHCHHPRAINFLKGVYFLNVDSRILIIEPRP